jgi:hypothetical protein
LSAIAGDLVEAIRLSPSHLVFPRADGTMQDPTKLTRVLRTAMGRAGIVDAYLYKCRRCGFRTEKPPPRIEDIECDHCDMQLWPVAVVPAIRWYDIRHSSATLHRKAGADPLAVKMLLGHVVRDITEGTYVHLSELDFRTECSKLEKLILACERSFVTGVQTRR